MTKRSDATQPLGRTGLVVTALAGGTWPQLEELAPTPARWLGPDS